MRHCDVYAVASKDIVFESFDGEAVVLDLSTGKYFGFSDSGSRIWHALSSGVSAQALAGQSAGGATISMAELEGFISRLLEYGLLAPLADTPAQPVSADRLADLAQTREPIRVEVHDDLADPIHEVEEPQGWPAVKHTS
ncbi:PqqD family protein [Mesorhizobium shangrilense]|uniref:PqqD family protein n=1 Tax=Mesorhizobium shangrilense TaxID=460060 RepID=A0ABV2DH81_9HYPH